MLPREIKSWLEKSLADGNFSGYETLEAELARLGYSIGKSSIHRYGKKLEARLAAIKASTEAARAIAEAAPDDADLRSEAVIALVQTELFDIIVSLQEAGDEEIAAADRVKLLSNAAKNIATLSRASVNLKEYQVRVREKDAAKLAQLEGEAQSGKSTLDLATIKRIREELYGIV